MQQILTEVVIILTLKHTITHSTRKDLAGSASILAKIGQYAKSRRRIGHKLLSSSHIEIENNNFVDAGGPA